MSRSSLRALVASTLGLVLCLSGCTTFEVRDAYRVVEGQGAPSLDGDGPRHGFWIMPDTRFSSIGLLGAPAVPTHLDAGPSQTLTLMLWLEPRPEHAFAVAQAPCLSRNGADALCPEETRVSLFADTANTGIADAQNAFSGKDHVHRAERKLQQRRHSEASGRIERAQVLDWLGLAVDASWRHLRIEVAYVYRCDGPCPPRLTLDSGSLMTSDGHPLRKGHVVYQRVRERDYAPITDVQ